MSKKPLLMGIGAHRITMITTIWKFLSYLAARRATLTRDCDANISDSLIFTRCYIRLTSALVIITHHSSDRCSLSRRSGFKSCLQTNFNIKLHTYFSSSRQCAQGHHNLQWTGQRQRWCTTWGARGGWSEVKTDTFCFLILLTRQEIRTFLRR